MTSLTKYAPLFLEEDHSGTSLHNACLKVYGPEYLDLELEALELNILQDLNVDEVAFGVFDRLHAINISISTELYYKYFESFEDVTKALNFSDPLPTAITPCLPEEIVASIWEIGLNDTEPSQFSPEVVAYIRECFRHAGYYKVPRELEFTRYNELYDTSWLLDKYKAIHEEQQQRINTYLKLRKEQLAKETATFFS